MGVCSIKGQAEVSLHSSFSSVKFKTNIWWKNWRNPRPSSWLNRGRFMIFISEILWKQLWPVKTPLNLPTIFSLWLTFATKLCFMCLKVIQPPSLGTPLYQIFCSTARNNQTLHELKGYCWHGISFVPITESRFSLLLPIVLSLFMVCMIKTNHSTLATAGKSETSILKKRIWQGAKNILIWNWYKENKSYVGDLD